MIDRDLQLIGGQFLDEPIENSKHWMKKYFKTKIQYQFLKYFYIFGSINQFINHTGFFCTLRYLKKLKKKYFLIEYCHGYFREKGDFENISKLESGKFKITKLKKYEKAKTSSFS